MTRDAALLEKLYAVTRGDLERAVHPLPSARPLANAMTFSRIRRLSAFWNAEGSGGDGLRQSTADLLTGFHAQDQSWIFALHGRTQHLECWFGVRATDSQSVSELLCGAYPDAQLESAQPAFPAGHLPHAFVVTGSPSAKLDSQGGPTDQIERVVRGLAGREWLYLVSAGPVSPSETLRAINSVTTEIRDASSTFLLKHAAVDETDRTAKRYIELLEHKLRRLEEARSSGMWRARVSFFADSVETLRIGRGLLASAFGGTDSVPEPLRFCTCSPDASTEIEVEPLSTPDVAILVKPPREEYPGFGINEAARYGVDIGGAMPTTAVALGDTLDRGRSSGNPCWIRLEDLTKHALIAGVTGSGKTNTCVRLLAESWKRGVPFLVIESAKSEYRTLLAAAGIDTLTVFTIGNEAVAPLRLSPFEVPPGALLQTHIDYLKSLFGAAFVLYPPMPYVLEQSIQEMYEDCGWDVARNVNARGAGSLAFPTLSDLADKIPMVVDRMGYDQRITMDVKAGLVARINQLRRGGKGLMLDTRRSAGVETLFERPCLLELKQLVSDDEKAFLIGLLLIRLYEHCETRQSGPGLSHLMLIEEAHRLLRSTSDRGNEVAANPRGQAIEVFANILSEIRAFGEGIILAEQAPTKLIPDAIKNTNLKVVHRLVAADDRTLLGGTMHLTDSQERRLATLNTGEAVVFREGLITPIMVQVPLAPRDSTGIPDSSVARQMAGYYQEHPWFFDRIQACQDCPSRGGPKSCRWAVGADHDPAFRSAFERFFNDLRFGRAAVHDSYDDARQHHEAQFADGETALDCVLRHAVHEELHRRGNMLRWDLNQLDRINACASVALRELAGTSGSGDGVAVTRFAEEMALLERPERRPFAGCSPCQHACRYRADVAAVVGTNHLTFRNAFENKAIRWGTVVDFCRNSAAEAIPEAPPPARNAAAFCFAVQQVATLAYSSSIQQALARQFYRHLIEGEPDGAS